MIFPPRDDDKRPSVSFQQFCSQALGVHCDPGTKEKDRILSGPSPDHSHYWRSLTHEDTQWGHKEPRWPSGSGKLLKTKRNHGQGFSLCKEASQRYCPPGNSPVHCKASVTQCSTCMGQPGSRDQDLAGQMFSVVVCC